MARWLLLELTQIVVGAWVAVSDGFRGEATRLGSDGQQDDERAEDVGSTSR